MDTLNPDDPVAIYLSEIGNVEPLSKGEETRLFQQLAAPGNWVTQELVIRRLIEPHLPEVVTIAQKHSASGIPLLDLIQKGNLGLINAVKSFAKSPVGDFSDYAANCINDAITGAFG